MRVAIVYNKKNTNVINPFGMQNKEIYNPKTVKRVADALEAGGHNVEIIDGNMNVIENIRAFLPPVTEGEKFGLVFNMAYGIQGESRYTHIPAMLEMLGIPYVGSTPSGHAVALDKIITKIILQKNDIPTPNFWFFSSADEDMSGVEYPVIVKPKMESVSFGLRVVHNEADLKEAVAYIISEFHQQALVEAFIRGREFAVGLIGNDPVEVFPVLEIDLEGDPDAIQTADDKKSAPRAKICPAQITPELEERMKDLSIKVFKSLGLRDFSRVDIRLDEKGDIYILEINSMASLGSTGSYVTAALAYGLDFNSLVNRMLDVATIRYFASQLSDTAQSGTSKKYQRRLSFEAI
ncbi:MULTISPECIES: ATP-grasp domain-containing protein [unclassified Fusibacter]|uniref:D-alanine--D-alanine ligase family protein n=1 Tax=unclassified Fusibacter TaxID=2624464 RepID=UPI001012689D|nr:MULTISPECIES: ATP-grasp domain-containing protein [unclassified Fusibacter]MCK8060039.1 ATP-grasp domain-containing protein [Fusibacter sp. A2]NPE22179.1 ATP-grasp domain-containing protein [Fusibacter sp. A1]RXV60955.1 ATP-grasp domain-containing protein [Fusibacter sp. A1]